MLCTITLIEYYLRDVELSPLQQTDNDKQDYH